MGRFAGRNAIVTGASRGMIERGVGRIVGLDLLADLGRTVTMLDGAQPQEVS